MRAWQVHQLGAPRSALELVEVDRAPLAPGEVRLRVDAAALNFPDVLICAGLYQVRPELPFTPGFECAGTVLELGLNVQGLAVGQRVTALTGMPRGSLADEVVVPAAVALPIPAAMAATAAAGFTLTYQTVHVGLHRRARLQAGETVLVHAGAGGVGSAAIQVAKAAGARVIATAGSADKAQVCRDLGADLALALPADELAAAVNEWTDRRGADVIVDPVGGDLFDASRRCVAFEGRILVVGFTSGRIPEIPANHVLVKNYSVVGLHWGLYLERNPQVVLETHLELVRLWEAKAIEPLVSEVLPLAEAPRALERLASRQTTGKVVLVP